MNDIHKLEDSAERGYELVKRFCAPARLESIPAAQRQDIEDLGNFIVSQALAFASGHTKINDLQANCYFAVAAALGVAQDAAEKREYEERQDQMLIDMGR